MTPPLRFAYNTNGLAHHRLEEALDLLADAGYAGVGLTLDVHHLDPYRSRPSDVARVRDHLARRGLACVVETGARFLLDAARKHQPTLLSGTGAEVRRDFLLRAVDIAADLGAPVVSTWSGAADPGTPPAVSLGRLLAGLEPVCDRAAEAGGVVGFEPEPGMFVEDLGGWRTLRERLPHPALGLTLDAGHVLCEPGGDPATAVTDHARDLVNVHVEDMKRGVHEHLPFGRGDLDLRGFLNALSAIGYGGLVGVELSRDSHRAVEAVGESMAAPREASAPPTQG
jgi:L-ribulose-5-phosphate 3-epimerase